VLFQVHVAWLEGGTAVFAFRGTESVKDALADLNAMPIEIDWMKESFPDVLGHSGTHCFVHAVLYHAS
jgi:hypothetical protein